MCSDCIALEAKNALQAQFETSLATAQAHVDEARAAIKANEAPYAALDCRVKDLSATLQETQAALQCLN